MFSSCEWGRLKRFLVASYQFWVISRVADRAIVRVWDETYMHRRLGFSFLLDWLGGGDDGVGVWPAIAPFRGQAEDWAVCQEWLIGIWFKTNTAALGKIKKDVDGWVWEEDLLKWKKHSSGIFEVCSIIVNTMRQLRWVLWGTSGIKKGTSSKHYLLWLNQ